MAALAVETTETLSTIGQRSRQLGEQFQRETQAATASLEKASTMAHIAAGRLAEESRRSIWSRHLIALATGVTSAILVSVFWLWLAPPIINNQVDVGEIVRQLKPEIAALKPSKGK
ncbi:mobilization protein [Massilia sp. R2A-15]|uniref:mobilization protein n=1 Tax=Massilia sp. R2A-15 TaxID=3064278 RepID=UPI0035A6B33A